MYLYYTYFGVSHLMTYFNIIINCTVSDVNIGALKNQTLLFTFIG